jgi:hypothetical protein
LGLSPYLLSHASGNPSRSYQAAASVPPACPTHCCQARWLSGASRGPPGFPSEVISEPAKLMRSPLTSDSRLRGAPPLGVVESEIRALGRLHGESGARMSCSATDRPRAVRRQHRPSMLRESVKKTYSKELTIGDREWEPIPAAPGATRWLSVPRNS